MVADMQVQLLLEPLKENKRMYHDARSLPYLKARCIVMQNKLIITTERPMTRPTV